MTIFNSEDTASLADPNDLIGEGKKYETQDAANKALAHSQVYIKQLEREHEEMRAEIAAAARVEELLEVARQKNLANSSQVNPPVVEPPANQEIDLDKRIQDRIKEMDAAKQTQANINAVADKVVEVLGSREKAEQYIQDKAKELGVGTQFLMDVAASSPKAFFQTVGLNASATPTPGASKSDVNPSSFNSGSNTAKPGTYAYYEDMRKTDKKAYFTPKIQQQMMNEALNNPSFFT